VLVVILMSISFLMHYLTCVYKICSVKCKKTFLIFFIEVRLASMMHAPSPRSLHLMLWEPMRLALFKTKMLAHKYEQVYSSIKEFINRTI